jgi:asparagine synthase (glutamine-hydrolysing)
VKSAIESAQDLVFAGVNDVVVVNGRRDFVAHHPGEPGCNTYLAGSYADQIAPAHVRAEQSASLFGQFVLLRHNERSRTLTVTTDRFGHFPLYMASEAKRLYLATDIASLAQRTGAGSSPDYAAMSDIVAFNVPFDQRTPLSRIASVGGSHELTIDLDTLAQSSRKLWDPVTLLATADLRFDDVKDQLVDLFLEGVSLATAKRSAVAVTLSGGADSRCLLAASLHVGKRTAVYSTGVPGSRALAYAHDMARLCGVQDNPHPLSEDFVVRFPALMRESNHALHGMSFASEVEAMWLREHVAPEGVLLHGAFAELYKIGKMHNYQYDSSIGGLSGGAVGEQLWERFAGRYATRRQGLALAYRASLGEQAHEHLAAKVAHYQRDLHTAGVLQMIYLDEFLGKVAKGSWNMWRQRVPTMFPFAYPPLVDLILRVRTADKVLDDFVVHLLRRTNAKLARYPDSNTGARIGASWANRGLVRVIDYVANRLIRHKARSDHQDFPDWLTRMQPGLETVFETLQAASGVFDMKEVAALTAQCRAGNDAASRVLQFLWAWGLWKTDGPMTSATP